ncbi:hypothetical protein [Mycolicibacterium thermoresistibile]
MTAGVAVAVAVVFCWLGIVIAISFIEAPLKFRAPGVTLQIGLGIGRLVFRAVNSVEAVLAVAAIAGLLLGGRPLGGLIAVLVAAAALTGQLLAVRPRLSRRSDAVLADPGAAGATRSRAHYAYVALELVKVAALLTGGVLLLAG